MTAEALWVVRLVVCAVFGLAAWAKMTDPARTRETVTAFGIPDRLAPVAGWALPAAEFLVAVGVLSSATVVLAGSGALLLLVAFSGAVAVQLGQDRHPSCACFGAASTAPISWWTLARNGGIGVLVAVAVWGSSDSAVPDSLPGTSTAGLAAIVGFAALHLRQSMMMRALRIQVDELRTPKPSAVGLPVGAAAPGFDLPGIDGTRTSLADLQAAGLPVALIFLNPGCDPCKLIAVDLQALRTWNEQKVTLIAIGSGDLAANAAWAGHYDLGPMLVQDRSEVATGYQVTATPAAVLIDSRGRIAAPAARGARDVRALLTEQRPAPAHT